MSNEQPHISILGNKIPYVEELRDIFQLKYYERNPRVLPNLGALDGSPEAKQKAIEEGMREETSVDKLLSSIPKHGGISEPLIIRPNGEVLEGNSRLAALRILYKKKEEEEYLRVPCRVVNLNEEEIDAFLDQQHVDGKTPWAAYNKAYKAFYRVVVDDVPLHIYARRTSSTKSKVEESINTIKLMMREKMSHKKDLFSYYQLFYKNGKLKKCFEEDSDLKKYVLKQLKKEKIPFEARELRDGLPKIVKYPKWRNELIKETTSFITLKEIAQRATQLDGLGENIVKSATRELKQVEQSTIEPLGDNQLQSFEDALNKCIREIDRIQKLIERVKS